MNFSQSIAQIWADTPELAALVPFEKVYTGRVPDTTHISRPYVSMIQSAATRGDRSDKNQLSYVSLSFHIWVDEAGLALGQKIEETVTATYAERCWRWSSIYSVIDMLDEGPARPRQVNEPTFKAWELVKLFTVCVQRERSDAAFPPCCEPTSSSSFSYSSESSSSYSSESSSSYSSESSSSSTSTPSSEEASSSSSSAVQAASAFAIIPILAFAVPTMSIRR